MNVPFENSMPWSKTAAANDLEGTMAFYSNDATLRAPNAPVAIGKQSIRASWVSLLGPGVSVSWQVNNKVEVSRSGDLAYLTTAWTSSSGRTGKSGFWPRRLAGSVARRRREGTRIR